MISVHMDSSIEEQYIRGNLDWFNKMLSTVLQGNTGNLQGHDRMSVIVFSSQDLLDSTILAWPRQHTIQGYASSHPGFMWYADMML